MTWTDCDEAGDYVVPNVLSPRDLVSRPDNMDETVLHTYFPTISFCGYFRRSRADNSKVSGSIWPKFVFM